MVAMVGLRIGARIGIAAGVAIGTSTGDAAVPPSFVAAGAPQSAVGAITVPWPAGHRVGDIGILIIEVGADATTLTSDAGFVEIANSPQSSTAAGTATKLAAFWCRATSTSMASPVFGAVANGHALGAILAFRGCIAAGNPVDVSAGGSTGASASTSVAVPGATTTVDHTLVVAVCSQGVDAGVNDFTAWANANLDNVTEILDLSTSVGDGGGIGIAAGTKARAGAYGNTTATLGTTSGQARISFALKGLS